MMCEERREAPAGGKRECMTAKGECITPWVALVSARQGGAK